MSRICRNMEGSERHRFHGLEHGSKMQPFTTYCHTSTLRGYESSGKMLHTAENLERRTIRPFLTQSDPASRKRPFSTGLLFDWILLVLLVIVRRVDFIVFVLFLEAVGVREYCCTAGDIGWQLCASCFLRKQRLDEP